MASHPYDPFSTGPSAVAVRTLRAADQARGLVFPVEVWQPADLPAGALLPLVIYSHFSFGHRRAATFLCTHLASHGYAVAALDHCEVVAADLVRAEDETADQRAARIDAIIASRVPDTAFLLDFLLGGGGRAGLDLDAGRIGLVGHSFGGWTVLAVPNQDSRASAVVALAPGGGDEPKPGILPLTLEFAWSRAIPLLLLTGEDDVSIPLSAVQALYCKALSPKQMVVLRRADHMHFMDDVEVAHEAVRAADFGPEAAWIPAAMRPIDQLCSGAQAHLFTRGLTLAHFDAVLRGSAGAQRLLAGDIEAELAARGVEAFSYPGGEVP